MSDSEPVTQWLRQLQSGDEDAPDLLWRRYYGELVALARARFGTMPRRVIDEEDVALSVLRCLYDGSARGQFSAIVNRRELWRLLAAITRRKVIDHQRLLNQQKRGGGLVRGDSVLQGSGGQHCRAGFDRMTGQAPTPEVLAIAADQYRCLMLRLDDDRLRQIARWKLEGYRNEEIGARLGLACRSIERKLQRIREIWEGELQP